MLNIKHNKENQILNKKKLHSLFETRIMFKKKKLPEIRPYSISKGQKDL